MGAEDNSSQGECWTSNCTQDTNKVLPMESYVLVRRNRKKMRKGMNKGLHSVLNWGVVGDTEDNGPRCCGEDCWGSIVWSRVVVKGLSEKATFEIRPEVEEPGRAKLGQRWSRDQFHSYKGPHSGRGDLDHPQQSTHSTVLS